MTFFECSLVFEDYWKSCYNEENQKAIEHFFRLCSNISDITIQFCVCFACYSDLTDIDIKIFSPHQ